MFLLTRAANLIFAVDENTGNAIYTDITKFLGPILLLIIAAISLTYLFKRQLTQFFQFAALAVLVGILFYTPGVIEAIARWLSSVINQ